MLCEKYSVPSGKSWLFSSLTLTGPSLNVGIGVGATINMQFLMVEGVIMDEIESTSTAYDRGTICWRNPFKLKQVQDEISCSIH